MVKNKIQYLIFVCIIILSSLVFANPTITTPVLISDLGISEYALDSDNLTCSYNLTGSSYSSSIAWYKNNSPIIALYLPFEGNSTNALLDYSGNNNIIINNNVVWNSTSGYDGKGAFEFNGITSSLNITNSELLNLTNSFTISAWIYPKSSTGGWIVNKNIDSLSNTEYGIVVSDSFGYISGYISGSIRVSSTAIITTNLWHYITYTWDGNVVNMYYNGVLNATSNYSTPITPTSQSILIGKRKPNNILFNGTIDDVRIYNYSLSPEQILALYNNRTDLIVSQETNLGETWQCRVTPFNSTFAGTTYISNNITIASLIPISISYSEPTYPDYYVINENYTLINVSSDNTLSSCVLEWNGTNESMSVIGNYAYKNKSNSIEELFTYKVYCNNSFGLSNSTEYRHLEFDFSPPFIQFYSPITPTYQTYDNFNIEFNVSDVNLYAVNITMFNSTNGVVWNVYEQNITTEIYSFNQSSNLTQSYQNYTLEVCGADDHTNGIKPDKKILGKDKIEFTDKIKHDKTNLEIMMADKNMVKIDVKDNIVFTFDSKSDKWNFSFTSSEKMKFVYVNVTSDIPFVDRSFKGLPGHLVWGNNYHDFSVMKNYFVDGISQEGIITYSKITDYNYIFKLEFEEEVNNDSYVLIDPMTGGLNINCENKTIEYLAIAPSITYDYPLHNQTVWGNNQDINITVVDLNSDFSYCYANLTNISGDFVKVIDVNFTSNTEINYTDLFYGYYNISTTCYDDYSLSSNEQRLINVFCEENWIPEYTHCDINFTKSLTYYDNNSCGVSYNLPTDNGTIINCSCNNTFDAIIQNQRYCDLNTSCYVYVDTEYEEEFENNITMVAIINNTRYNMSYADGVWYIETTSLIEEDVNIEIEGFFQCGDWVHECNTTCFSGSTTLKFRDAYYVNIELFKKNVNNQTKQVCSEFNYVYLKFTDLIVGDYSPISLQGRSETYNWWNNYLKVNNKRSFGNDFSFGNNGVDESTYFWGKYIGCKATIQLFERGGHDVYVLNAKVNDNSSIYEQFYKPSRYDNPDLDSLILRGYNFTNETTLQLLVNPMEAVPYTFVDNIVATIVSIVIVILIHLLIIGIFALMGQTGMYIGFHLSGILAFITIPVLIIYNVVLWVF